MCRIIRFAVAGLICAGACSLGAGCASIRVTDPPQTADEQFLKSTAATEAVAQLSLAALRDRKVWIDSSYFNAPEQAFVVGELRARMLLGGIRLVADRHDAQIIVELRSGGVGVDHTEYLLGIPSVPIPGIGAAVNSSSIGSLAASTPELAIIKTTKQQGYASVAYVAYWAQTGEIVTASGPFVGRTLRNDTWLFGTGPSTTGNIPTTEHPK
jgi:hypothetical protein